MEKKKEIFELMEKAHQGDAMAQNDLGVSYETGEGVEQNYSEALKWYQAAANQGHAIAQSNLGNMYFNGWGVPQNYEESVKWYRLAAEQGDSNAAKIVKKYLRTR